MRGVILAAGQGKRLGALTAERPKCLLPLGEWTILDHQLESFRRCGIQDVTVVAGFRADQVQEVVGDRARCLVNENYRSSGSLASFLTAWRAQAGGPLILLNGDVVAPSSLMSDLLEAPEGESITVDFRQTLGAEETKVVVQDGLVQAIGKHLDPLSAQGESVGMLRLSDAGARAAVRWAEAQDLADRTLDPPAALRHLLQEGVPVGVVSTGSRGWTEVDFPADLEYAQELFRHVTRGA